MSWVLFRQVRGAAKIGVQAAGVMFNNFDLVADLPGAVGSIRKDQTVDRGPDRSGAHARWYEFAKFAIKLDIDKAYWEKMSPILLEGTEITTKILDPVKKVGGVFPAANLARRLTAAQIAALWAPIAKMTAAQREAAFGKLLITISTDSTNDKVFLK